MADKITKIDSEKMDTASSVNDFLMKNRKPVLCVAAIVVVAIVVGIVTACVTDSIRKNDSIALDSISFELTKNSSALSDEEISERRKVAMDKLSSYASKKNIIGARANLLIAELYYQMDDFENARSHYLNVASISNKSYLAPNAYYNAAQCSESLKDYENAVSYYEKALTYNDFAASSHTLFNIGRVKEQLKDYEGAKEAYSKITSSYSSDEWAKLAKSRLIDFDLKGLVK
ncbi:MAG: tetratricopeptide repeat protein [Treponema sp.]|nr:tetratricopeptide repeat protein [Treponema sp.]